MYVHVSLCPSGSEATARLLHFGKKEMGQERIRLKFNAFAAHRVHMRGITSDRNYAKVAELSGYA